MLQLREEIKQRIVRSVFLSRTVLQEQHGIHNVPPAGILKSKAPVSLGFEQRHAAQFRGHKSYSTATKKSHRSSLLDGKWGWLKDLSNRFIRGLFRLPSSLENR